MLISAAAQSQPFICSSWSHRKSRGSGRSTPHQGHLPGHRVCSDVPRGTHRDGEAQPYLTTSLNVRRLSLSSSSVRGLWSWLWIWTVAVRKVFVTVCKQRELM